MCMPRNMDVPRIFLMEWHMNGVLQGYLKLYQGQGQQLCSFYTVRPDARHRGRWTNWHGTFRRLGLADTTLLVWFNCAAPDQPNAQQPRQPRLHMATIYFEAFPEGHGYDYQQRTIRAVMVQSVDPALMQARM